MRPLPTTLKVVTPGDPDVEAMPWRASEAKLAVALAKALDRRTVLFRLAANRNQAPSLTGPGLLIRETEARARHRLRIRP